MYRNAKKNLVLGIFTKSTEHDELPRMTFMTAMAKITMSHITQL